MEQLPRTRRRQKLRVVTRATKTRRIRVPGV